MLSNQKRIITGAAVFVYCAKMFPVCSIGGGEAPKDNGVETNNNSKQQQKEPYLEFPSLLRLAANGGRLLRDLLYKLSERG